MEGGGTSRTRYPQALLKGVNTPWTPDYELDTEIFVKQCTQPASLQLTTTKPRSVPKKKHAAKEEGKKKPENRYSLETGLPPSSSE